MNAHPHMIDHRLLSLTKTADILLNQHIINKTIQYDNFQAFYQQSQHQTPTQTRGRLRPPERQIRGYLVKNIELKTIDIIFIGTKTIRDLKHDLKFKKEMINLPSRFSSNQLISSGKVHSGFYKLTNECRLELNTLLNQSYYLNLEVPYSLRISGHSLGAAMAVFYCLLNNFKNITVTLFCTPKLGNNEFNRYFKSYCQDHAIQLQIIKNHYDFITWLPPIFFGYRSLRGDSPSQTNCCTRTLHCNPHSIRHLLDDF